MDPHGLLAAALSVRVTADTTGLDAEIASKLTAAERRAVQTSERVSAATGRVAEVGAASSAKLEAGVLRQTAAQESYNRLLRAGETDTVRLARAQASLITAQAGVRREQTRLAEATAATSRTGEAATLGMLGGTRNLVAGAAGLGVFTALKRGVGAYEQLTGSVRSFQRATGAAAPDASRFVAILDRYGLSGDRATQAILRFGRNIAEHPEKLRQFGVEIAKNSDGTVNLTKSLLNANTAFHNTPDATNRASLALSLFGRGGQSLLPVLAANRDTLQGFMDEAERAGVVFSQGDLDRAKELAMAQKSLTEAWQGFEIVLARGVVPALKDVDKFGTAALNLFTDHRTVGTAVLRLGEVAAVLYGINKAIKVVDSARSSAVFSKMFNVDATNAQTIANERLAASELAVASAAGVEAAALGGVGVASAGAVIGTGMAARLPAGLATAGRVGGLARGVGGAALGFGAFVNNPRSLGFPSGFYKGETGPGGRDKVAATIFYDEQGHAFTDPDFKHPYIEPGAAARQAQQLQGQQQVSRQILAAFAATGRQYASGIDIFSRAAPLTPRADPQAAQALASARTRADDAARRVTLDQQRLNALRATGKASTLQLAGAEETLRLAKERSAKASQDVTDAEKKSHAERLPTARSLLATTTSQAHRARLDARAVEQLYGVGLGPNVVARIVAQNANQPGLLESVAKTETPKLAAELNRQFRQIRIDGSLIMGTPEQARKVGQTWALNVMAGVQNTFNQAAPPVITARLAGVERKIGANDLRSPSSRSRQRSLSGSPSLPHGA